MKNKVENFLNGKEVEIYELNPNYGTRDLSPYHFWYFSKNQLRLNSLKFIKLLEFRGYRKLRGTSGCRIIYIANNIVEEVDAVHIKDNLLSFFKEADDSFFDDVESDLVLEKLINRASSLFSQGSLEFLDNPEGDFKFDSEDTSIVYFSNCFVNVTIDNVTTHAYDELDGLIWRHQIIEHDFCRSEAKSDVERFISKISKDDESRINSAKSVIGYLLHCYKNQANAKAIFFMDEKIDDGANGGSGKSLLGNLISKVRKSLRLPGRVFKFDRFSMQSLELGTNVIEFNDVDHKFPFEKLFTAITDDLTVEKKNRDEIIVKFEQSPKILLSTNYAPTGIDESSLRRQFILEFSDYFNMKYTPEMEFGKRFFDEWNEDEWNSFYNFMIGCLQYYLQNGLVEYTRINLDHKKLIFSTSEEFIDFMDEIELDNYYEKKEQFQKFIELNPNLKTMHQKTFSRWLKIFAKLKNLKYEEKKSGAKRSFVLSNKNNGRMDEAKCSLTGEEDII